MGCGATQPVRAVEEGATHVIASLGGPLIPFGGTTIPVPYLTAGILYGFSNETSITATTHVTMLLFGNLGLDVGYVKRLVTEEEWIPEVTAKGHLYVFSDLKHLANTRFFPLVTLNGSYSFGSSLLYAGTDHVIQLHQPAYFISPFLGGEFSFGERWRLQTELKWMAANVRTANGVFEGHASIGGYGNIGFFLGLMYRW